MGRGDVILTANELVFPFGGSYICANFGENQSRNTTVRVPQMDILTDANRFYNLSHAICYSYGTDKNTHHLSVFSWQNYGRSTKDTNHSKQYVDHYYDMLTPWPSDRDFAI